MPIKRYTTADGLANNQVNRIFRDSRGYLWFCTNEGLSRFDGYQFTTYSTDDGLEHPVVKDILETRTGQYWIGTGNGLLRFNPSRIPEEGRLAVELATKLRLSQTVLSSLFVPCKPADNRKTSSVYAVFEDSHGGIWCATGLGLFRVSDAKGQQSLQFIDIGLPTQSETDQIVRSITEDHHGALWIAAGSGLYRRWPDGRTDRYTKQHGLPVNEVRTLVQTRDQRLWAGTILGLCQIVQDPVANKKVVERTFTERQGFYVNNVRSLCITPENRFLVGLPGALCELTPRTTGSGNTQEAYTVSTVLPDFHVQAIEEDSNGNLWLGTDSGAVKLVKGGLTTYTSDDGLGHSVISSISQDQEDGIIVTTLVKELVLSRFDGKRFLAVRPNLDDVTYPGWGWGQLTLQDSHAEWWIPTGQGLFRFPKLETFRQLGKVKPRAVFNSKNGLPADEIFRLFEDTQGDIWIATFSEERNGITRWRRASGALHTFSQAEGLPSSLPIVHAFLEDGNGAVWIGLEHSMLLRFKNDRFRVYDESDGVPSGYVTALHSDRKKRLWIGATLGGLACIQDVSAEVPRVDDRYTMKHGLSSNQISCITEDKLGRIYVCTGRGIDRLEPETRAIRHFTTADGLAGGSLRAAFCDKGGDLWFGAIGGLSRLVPDSESFSFSPTVVIANLSVSDRPLPISELGEHQVSMLNLGPHDNRLRIDFVAPGVTPVDKILYQYRLDGADKDWSAPTDQRSVNYANLRPGTYRFQVRAITLNGVASRSPATVSFSIKPPFWQRWWFLTLMASAVGMVGYGVHRYRMNQLLALQRIRMRIASDLHDDIGANLTKIAILSEVAHQQSDGSHETPFSTIARISRESVASMSDIVWAINPKRDSLRELVRRMRRFANEIFSSRNVELHFEASALEQDVALGADIRRDVFLIFKEAVNNIVRHSVAKRVEVEMKLDNSWLLLQVTDDGRGFDCLSESDGNGLANMRRRTDTLRGRLEILSRPNQGTVVKFAAPISHWRSILPHHRAETANSSRKKA